MKVLIFSPEKPYTGAESLVTCKLMRVLINHGWEVNMIFHETDFLYSSKGDIFSIQNNCYCIENKKIRFLKHGLKDLPLLKNIHYLDSLLWVIKAFRLAVKLNRTKQFDLIFSRVMPQYGHLPAFLFKIFKKKTPWIANWSDPLPRSKSPFPYGKGVKAKTKVTESFFMRLIIKYVSWNTFPSNRLMEYFQIYLPELKSHSSVLPHVLLNNENITSLSGNDDKSLIITHVGGFGLRDPSNLLLAFKKLKVSGELKGKLKFRFIGYIDAYIFDLINKNNMTMDFSLEGVKTYEETLEAINMSDIMLVVEAPLLEGIFLPSKVLDYLQFNKPILAISPEIGVMNDLLGQFGGGIAVDCTSEDTIRKVLLTLSEDCSAVKNSEGIYNTNRLCAAFSENKFMNDLELIYKKCRIE